MPEKKNVSATYEQIMRDLNAGKFSPIYILMGEESYYIDKITDYIVEHGLQPAERDFNQSIVFGTDVSAAQVVDLAKGFPMMAARRIVVVREFQNMKNTEALENYFKHPAISTTLVLCYKNGTIDKRKKFFTIAQGSGAVIFESKKLYDRELPGFIEGYLRQQQATIEYKAAQMMAEFVGADLSRLTSELDKLLLSFSTSQRRITPELVEKEVGISKDFNAFELRNAIVNRDVFKANLIVKYFDKNPKSGSLFAFLPMLFSYFENLMIAHYTPNRTNENSLAQALELRSGWAARDYLRGMQNYSAMKTLQIISKVREIDAKSKGINNPNTEVGELMKELIFFILH